MELIKGENGTAPVRISPDVRAEVRAQVKKNKSAPIVPAKPGPFLEMATLETFNKRWAWIKQGLLTLKRKDKNSGNWTPEHVHNRILLGLANQAPVQLWFVKEQDKPAKDIQPTGYFIVTAYPDVYLNVPYTCWIWIVFGAAMKSRKLLKPAVKEIAEYARELGYADIQWATGRMSWAPIARSLGFESIGIIWRMKL